MTEKTILLVDDEKDMGWVIKQILTDAGYRVVTAKTGAEGLAKFRQVTPSVRLVLLDLRLPDMSGIELLKRIKAISSRTKILMITAFGTLESKKEAKSAGAMEVLDKPFRVEKVLKAARLAFEVGG
ncbi:MAG: response regulator [Candidatus Omnitrophica bacterium]|nr:response regulator [Candidatus Omnitrophota bacterium]